MARNPYSYCSYAHGDSRVPVRQLGVAAVLGRPNGTIFRLILPILAGLLIILANLGCGGGDGEAGGQAKGGQHAKAGGHPGGQGGPGKRPSQPPIPVAVEAAEMGAIASYYTATATLTAEKEAEILARVTGLALSLHCEEGDWVKKGQTLLRIDDSEYKLRLAQAEAMTANLEDRFNRIKGMVDQDLVSAEEFETVKNDMKSAEAAAELARLTLSYTNVEAPFTGRVVSRMVDIGQNVNSGQALFLVSDFDPLLAVVHVPSKEFKKLKPDQPVTLTLDSNKEKMQGRIKLVSPIIDPNSGTIKVTVEISKYPQGTRPGDFAEVSIVTERRTGSTLVPKIAVFTDRGDKIIYVAAADSTAERRVVEVGFEDDEKAEILNGVMEGEGVVVKGQRSLKHGAPLKIMDDQPITSPPPTARRQES